MREPRHPAQAAARARRAWPWALGSIAVVLLVLGSAALGRHVISGARQTPTVAAPAHPPLTLLAVTTPDRSYETFALDAEVGHIVALAAPPEPTCPPVAACPPPPAPTALVLLDAANGAAVTTTPLRDTALLAAGSAPLLVLDTTHHVAYLLAQRHVAVFSARTGEQIGGYDLPADVAWSSTTTALMNPAAGSLIVATATELLTIDASTGQLRARHALANGAAAPATADPPVLDAAANRLYRLARASATDAPLLTTYDATTLAPLARNSLPVGARLGPLDPLYRAKLATIDPRTQYLLILSADGTVARLATVAGMPSGGLSDAPLLRGALALGWDDHSAACLVASATTLMAFDSATGHTIAALPLRVTWPATQSLAVDQRQGLLYVPAGRGAIAIIGNASTAQKADGAGAAVVLARAALQRFLPDTNQDPPFVTPDTFPLTTTATGASRATPYWIHFAERGWQGPYNGTAQTTVTAQPGQPRAYTVRFTITWNQLFLRSHTWVCDVAADGSVALRAESGDVVP